MKVMNRTFYSNDKLYCILFLGSRHNPTSPRMLGWAEMTTRALLDSKSKGADERTGERESSEDEK